MFAVQRYQQRLSSICQQCRRTLSSTSARSAANNDDPFASLLEPQNEPYRPRRSTSNSNTNNNTFPPSVGRRGPPRLSANAVAESLAQQNRRTAVDAEKARDIADLGKQITRKWKAGDVYSPHDLSGVEMSKWKTASRRGKPKKDAFDILRLNPLDQYKNFTILSQYVTDMGRIKPMSETGLRPVNQRRVAKAIRRAIGIGLMPSVHKHPELLRGIIGPDRR